MDDLKIKCDRMKKRDRNIKKNIYFYILGGYEYF